MPDLLDILESFNRKERFFLVAQALGNPKFELSTGFREKLANAVDLEPGIEIPANAFAAMDYHLNWVHASLVLSHHTDESDRVSQLHLEGTTEDNQRDIDLLVAFHDGSKYRLIFVEAKGYDAKGFAPFDKGELCKKVKRLDKIINSNGKPKYEGVSTHFCLASGYKPQNLKSPDWPQWNGKTLHWMPLSLPEKRHVLNYSDFSIVKQEKGEAKSKFKSEKVVSGKDGAGKSGEGQA